MVRPSKRPASNSNDVVVNRPTGSYGAFKDPNMFLPTPKVPKMPTDLQEDSVTIAADSLVEENRVSEALEEEVVTDVEQPPANTEALESGVTQECLPTKQPVDPDEEAVEENEKGEQKEEGVTGKQQTADAVVEKSNMENAKGKRSQAINGTTGRMKEKSSTVSTASKMLPSRRVTPMKRKYNYQLADDSDNDSDLNKEKILKSNVKKEPIDFDVLAAHGQELYGSTTSKSKLHPIDIHGRNAKKDPRTRKSPKTPPTQLKSGIKRDDKAASSSTKKSTSERKTRHSSKQKQHLSAPEEKEPIFLEEWYFVVYNSFITVEGVRKYNDTSIVWHSGPIVETIHPHRVKTKSSSEYVLVGSMDYATAVARGASLSMAKRFKNGFPRNWKMWLEDEFKSRSNSSKKGKSSRRSQASSAVKTSKYNQYDGNFTTTDGGAFTYPPKLRRSRRHTQVAEDSLVQRKAQTEVKRRGQPRKQGRAQSPVSMLEEQSEVTALQRSSRGRIVKPRGTKTEYDFYGNVIRSPPNTVQLSGAVKQRRYKRKKVSPDRSVSRLENTLEVARAIDFSDNTDDDKDSEEQEEVDIGGEVCVQDDSFAVSTLSQEMEIAEEEEANLTEEEIGENEEIEIPVQNQDKIVPVKRPLGSMKSSTLSVSPSEVQSMSEDSIPVVQLTPLQSKANDVNGKSVSAKSERRVRFSDVHEYGPQGTTTYSIGEPAHSSSTSSGTDDDPEKGKLGSSEYSFQAADPVSSDSEVGTDSMVDHDKFVPTRRSCRNRRGTDFGEVINWDSLASIMDIHRGRKKKKASLTVEEEMQPCSFVPSDVGIVVKRKRGRPPKNKSSEMAVSQSKPLVLHESDSEDSARPLRGEIKSSHASVEKAPVKRKRGRPPSNKKSVKRDRVATKLTLPTQDMHGSDDSFDGTSHEWDPKDRIQLFNIVNSIPPTTTGFWSEVATHLGSHYSARECQLEYQNAATTLKHPPHKLRTRKNKRREDALAKKGTLKRKGQLRKVVQMLDEDYTDDVLNSTPMREIRMQVPNVSSDSDDGFPESADPTYKTPVHSLKRSLNAPVQQTPKLSDILDSPDLMQHNRSAADKAIYHFQKVQQKQKPKPRNHRSSKMDMKWSTDHDGHQIATLTDIQRKTMDRLNRDSDDNMDTYSEAENTEDSLDQI